MLLQCSKFLFFFNHVEHRNMVKQGVFRAVQEHLISANQEYDQEWDQDGAKRTGFVDSFIEVSWCTDLNM